ncbi:hypothetical protein [Halomarina litorea]|uniref:hypothetical protein n=1 Tax=Halomarina litorea TaxID=2961595 RepID=UPI0020C367B1|nr:hypothetical protein [Halomarina sp. BCD28]
MGLAEAVVILVVGYLAGVVTRWVAGLAAVVALVLAVFGLAAPEFVVGVTRPVLSVYADNELLFLAGFLFGIARGSC